MRTVRKTTIIVLKLDQNIEFSFDFQCFHLFPHQYVALATLLLLSKSILKINLQVHWLSIKKHCSNTEHTWLHWNYYQIPGYCAKNVYFALKKWLVDVIALMELKMYFFSEDERSNGNIVKYIFQRSIKTRLELKI